MNTRSKRLAPPLVCNSKQEGNNTSDLIAAATDNFRMINQLIGLIQQMQRALQEKNTQKPQVKEEVARLYTVHEAPQLGQGTRRVGNHPPVHEQTNMKEFVWAHIAQLQADLKLYRIPPVLRGHKAHGCFSLLYSDLNSSSSWTIYYTTLQVVSRYDRFLGSHPVLTLDHISLPTSRCSLVQSVFTQPRWKVSSSYHLAA